jgi:hypothetical protein
MPTDKAFRTMNDLVNALAKAETALAGGALDLGGLETACADARELYERLVILRHKAREAAVQAGQVPPHRPEAAAPPDHTAVAAPQATPPAAQIAEPSAIRLDTRPPEAAPRQVSLIEAIEASEKLPNVTAALQDAAAAREVAGHEAQARQGPPSLAEKLEKASIPDLAKAISLSHKFWFVAELFNGDRITYDKTIDRLNSMGGLAEAEAFIRSEVIAKLTKPADPEALATFTELVKRRYA